MTQAVLYGSEQGVGTITLNRPEKLNTMSDDLLEGALEALERAACDNAVRVVVLTGAGRAFCAGGDLEALSGRTGVGSRRDLSHGENVGRLRRVMRSSQLLMEMDKVTIAAINGACAGAGLSWACACDLRYGAQSAKFNVAFRNVGLSGDFGGTWTLPRVVGPAKARELYLLSPRFDAAEAERIGLLNKVLPDGQLMAHVRGIAAELVAAPPLALASMKKNLNDSLHLSFSELLDREAERHVAGTQTEDHVEAATAFLEKRTPSFKGK
jgi:2-(1,2-epoxy-1,2-dihydrophenyl)acetyl-CoA isomerase